MKSFLQLNESVNEEQLKHLEHVEDHHINAGHEGTEHAFNTLRQTANALRGKKSTATVPFDENFIKTYPHREEFGVDEIFTSMEINPHWSSQGEGIWRKNKFPLTNIFCRPLKVKFRLS